MEETILRAYLRLIHKSDIGSVALVRLLRQFGSLQNIAAALSDKKVTLEISKVCRQSFLDTYHAREARDCVETESSLHWQEQADCQLVPFESPDYPRFLRQVGNPPLLLYLQGKAKLLHTPCCAIVGSRLASAYGARHAQWFAHDLSAMGFTIVSGLAQGIDAAAHAGALQGKGPTIAVVGTGIDRVYPRRNQRLREQILDGGLVMSEFPLGAPPRAEHFPQRNRIIAGLSLGTLVIEGGLRSGSLITARLAGEQGREVFALPGPVSSSKSRGCHKLLRDGASLVETPQEVCDALLQSWNHYPETASIEQQESPTDTAKKVSRRGLSDIERMLFAELDEAEILLDSLINSSGLTPAMVTSTLLQLELKGLVQQRDGRVIRVE